MSGKGVDQINPHKLIVYLMESKLARKVEGYTEQAQKKEGKEKPSQTPMLMHVQEFLFALMNPSDEGRIFYEKVEDDVQIRYTLLDPTNHFRDIVEEARAVILAGGTMSPMSDYATHLFSYVDPERMSYQSYGHVIPATNLTALTLCKADDGTEFDFTFQKRNSDTMVGRPCCSSIDIMLTFDRLPPWAIRLRIFVKWYQMASWSSFLATTISHSS